MRRHVISPETANDVAVETSAPPAAIVDYGPQHWDRVGHLGNALTDSVRMDDGSSYQRRLYEPHQQRYDVPVTVTTPWFTGINGETADIAEKLMNEGMPVLVVSAPKPAGINLNNLHRLISLKRDAEVHHRILNDYEQIIGDTPTIISYGFSRGAMDGFGIQQLAGQHGRKVAYFDYLDPCVEHPLTPEDCRPDKLMLYLGQEALAAARTLLKPEGWQRLLRTAGDSAHLLQHTAVAFSVFSGEAGELARSVPIDAVGRLAFLAHSHFNHVDTYSKVFAQHPNIHFAPAPGYHASGNTRAQQASAVQRIVYAQQLVRANEPLESVDWSAESPARPRQLLSA